LLREKIYLQLFRQHLCPVIETQSMSQFHDRTGRASERDMAEVEESEMFVRNYQNMVFSVSARIVGNRADAEDITQEVFIRAYERFKELQKSTTVALLHLKVFNYSVLPLLTFAVALSYILLVA